MSTLCEQSVELENSVATYLDRIENLPPTPTVLIKLLEKFRQPHADVDEIVELVRRDPALAIELLRRCNSSFFGADDAIEDVNEAVYRLGFHEVYQITASFLGQRAMTATNVAPGFPAAELRRHSSIAALAAGMLAPDIGIAEGLAFTTALLHDLGKLAFAIAEQSRYVALVEHCKQTGTSLSRSERQAFGFTHSELGAQLLRRWGMTEEVVLPVLGHTDPAVPEKSDSLRVLTQAASELANHVEGASKGLFSATPEGQRLMEFFGLETNDVDGWEHRMRKKIKQFDATKPL